MKQQIKRHTASAIALTLLGMTLPAGSRASSLLQNSPQLEQGEFIHAVVFLAILIALVGISRLVKKSS